MLLHDCAVSCVKFIDVENTFLGLQETLSTVFLSQNEN